VMTVARYSPLHLLRVSDHFGLLLLFQRTGAGLNYDSLLNGTSPLEDNGRRPWASPTAAGTMGGANPGTAGGGANGNELLMPALLPTPHGQHAHASPPQAHGGQIPAGSRLSALHLNGGMPPMPPLSGGLMPTNGAAGNLLCLVGPTECCGMCDCASRRTLLRNLPYQCTRFVALIVLVHVASLTPMYVSRRPVSFSRRRSGTHGWL
jgi:hypothetical protein